MKVDIIELMKRAYVAGFKRSGEGYNGEYPFDFNNDLIRREVAEWIGPAIEEILETADADDP